MGDEATLTYTVPMPSDGAMSESASVLDFVKSGPPSKTRTPQSDVRGRLPALSSVMGRGKTCGKIVVSGLHRYLYLVE